MDHLIKTILNKVRNMLADQNATLQSTHKLEIENINKHPVIQKIDQEIAKLSHQSVIDVLNGLDPSKVISKTRDDLRKLKDRKKEVLNNLGYSRDDLKLTYMCKECHDAGVIDGNKICRCAIEIFTTIVCSYSQLDYAKLKLILNPVELMLGLSRRDNNNNNITSSAYRNYAKQLNDIINLYKAQNNTIENGNLFLYGQSGSGKTHVVKYIFKILSESGKFVFYISAPEMYELLENEKFGRKLDEIQKIRIEMILTSDFLIIDNFGIEFNHAYRDTFLFNILNTRLENGKSCIISSSMDLEQIREFYPEQIFSRIYGKFNIIRCLDINLNKFTPK